MRRRMNREDRRQRSEVRSQKTEDGSQKAEVRRRKTEDGFWILIIHTFQKAVGGLFSICLPAAGICFICAVAPVFCRAMENKTGNHDIPQDIVKVRAWVENGPKVPVTGQVSLVVEIASKTWFTQGTRIKNIEIGDAVIPTAHSFATNFTRTEGGRTWSVQQWTVIIHPMKEKTYVVPAIPVTYVTVDEKGKPVSGRVVTKPVQFRAVVPGELAGTAHWVATSRMTVRQVMDEPVNGRKVGDAVKQRVEIEAYDLPAMMLPVFSIVAPRGLAMYEDPAKLIDDVNRGTRIGKRVESITYVIEKPGSYRIPGRVYSWWNVHDRLVETITLPDRTIATAGFEKKSPDTVVEKKEKPLWVRDFSLGPVFVLCAAAAVFITVRLLLKRWNSPTRTPESLTEKQLRRALKTALKNKDATAFLRLFYAWFDRYGEGGRRIPLRRFLMEKGCVRGLEGFDGFMSHLYGKPALNTILPADDLMKELIRVTKPPYPFKLRWAQILHRHSNP